MDLEEWDSISCDEDPSGLFDAEDDISRITSWYPGAGRP